MNKPLSSSEIAIGDSQKLFYVPLVKGQKERCKNETVKLY